jgi:hypothetical protein
LEKDGTIGRFHLDFGLKRKKDLDFMDMDSTWFFEGSRSFLKAFVVLLVPVWMNPSGWLVSGFLRIGLVFLGLWISYVFGFFGFLTGTD